MNEEEEVVKLMRTSQTEEEWNANALKVQESHGGSYPSFWFKAIVMSRLVEAVSVRWGGSGKIEIR